MVFWIYWMVVSALAAYFGRKADRGDKAWTAFITVALGIGFSLFMFLLLGFAVTDWDTKSSQKLVPENGRYLEVTFKDAAPVYNFQTPLGDDFILLEGTEYTNINVYRTTGPARLVERCAATKEWWSPINVAGDTCDLNFHVPVSDFKE